MAHHDAAMRSDVLYGPMSVDISHVEHSLTPVNLVTARPFSELEALAPACHNNQLMHVWRAAAPGNIVDMLLWPPFLSSCSLHFKPSLMCVRLFRSSVPVTPLLCPGWWGRATPGSKIIQIREAFWWRSCWPLTRRALPRPRLSMPCPSTPRRPSCGMTTRFLMCTTQVGCLWGPLFPRSAQC